MLAVYLAETGVSRHSRPFLILTDEFNPSLQPQRGREEQGKGREGGEEGGGRRRKKQMEIGKQK